jgi:CxxC motif-containing protein (DUF1111 family)
MKLGYLAWYFLVALLSLTPIGIRILTWPTSQPQAVDATMVQEGKALFTHEWVPNDPLCNGGDGLGPVFNANSCVACHSQGGLGGSGGLKHNVTTFAVRPEAKGQQPREGVVHAHALSPRYQETLAMVHPKLPAQPHPPNLGMLVPLLGDSHRAPLNFPPHVHVSQRNTPALFGANLIDEIPDRVIIASERSQRLKWGLASADREEAPVGRALRLANGRVGHFGWKAQAASLSDFVQAACANELGLGNPGQAQPKPLGYPGYQPPGLDLTLDQCNQMTAFISALPRPAERLPEETPSREKSVAGKAVFHTIGCADCHTPNVGPVEGIYSDLLLHRMGQTLVGGGSYNEPPPQLPEFNPGEAPQSDEWRTPPLWGVADSAPYLHDGRASSLQDAIKLHGGQGARAAQRFANLGKNEQAQLVAFLSTLRAP